MIQAQCVILDYDIIFSIASLIVFEGRNDEGLPWTAIKSKEHIKVST